MREIILPTSKVTIFLTFIRKHSPKALGLDPQVAASGSPNSALARKRSPLNELQFSEISRTQRITTTSASTNTRQDAYPLEQDSQAVCSPAPLAPSISISGRELVVRDARVESIKSTPSRKSPQVLRWRIWMGYNGVCVTEY